MVSDIDYPSLPLRQHRLAADLTQCLHEGVNLRLRALLGDAEQEAVQQLGIVAAQVVASDDAVLAQVGIDLPRRHGAADGKLVKERSIERGCEAREGGDGGMGIMCLPQAL